MAITEMSKVHKYYDLNNLLTVEVEFISSQQIADKRGSVSSGTKYKTDDVVAFVHHIGGDHGYTNHSYKGYNHWVTTDTPARFHKSHVKKTFLSTLAVNLLRFVMWRTHE